MVGCKNELYPHIILNFKPLKLSQDTNKHILLTACEITGCLQRLSFTFKDVSTTVGTGFLNGKQE